MHLDDIGALSPKFPLHKTCELTGAKWGPISRTHTHNCRPQLCHTKLVYARLFHIQLFHVRLCHTQIFRTQPCQQASFTPSSFTQNIVAHKFVTAHLSYPTPAHRTLSHTTCSHVALSHATGKSSQNQNLLSTMRFIFPAFPISFSHLFGAYWKLECVQCLLLLLLLTFMPNAAVFFALHLSRPICTLWTVQRYGCFSLSSVTQKATNPFSILNKPILHILPAPKLTHTYCAITLSSVVSIFHNCSWREKSSVGLCKPCC